MANIAVALRNDGSIDLDIQEGKLGDWCSSNVTLVEAKFILEELAQVVIRAEKYQPKVPEPSPTETTDILPNAP